MSNRGIDLITRYYELKADKAKDQMNLDHHIRVVAELKLRIDESENELKELEKKAPELFEQLEKEYE